MRERWEIDGVRVRVRGFMWVGLEGRVGERREGRPVKKMMGCLWEVRFV